MTEANLPDDGPVLVPGEPLPTVRGPPENVIHQKDDPSKVYDDRASHELIPRKDIPDHDLYSVLFPHASKTIIEEESSYHQGMLLDTVCSEARIHDYGEMKGKLESLQASYPHAAIESIGHSTGYKNPENAREILAFHLFASKSARRTAYFVAGHHPYECAGSETVYELAKRLLEASAQGNNAVQKMRKHTHMIFIPHLDPDIPGNVEEIGECTRETFYLQGYSYLPQFQKLATEDEVLAAMLLAHHEPNYYGDSADYNSYRLDWLKENEPDCLEFPDDLVDKCGSLPSLFFGPAPVVKTIIPTYNRRFQKPLLAFDYHENAYLQSGYNPLFEILWDGPLSCRKLMRYAVAEVGKCYPELARRQLDRSPLFWLAETFTGYMSSLGALSFNFETPSDRGLCQRIEMNLIATDRILARHYLGI